MASFDQPTSMPHGANLKQTEQHEHAGDAGMLAVNQSQAELSLSSFAALLSSAKTYGDDSAQIIPSSQSQLARFLSPHIAFDSTNPRASHSVSFPGMSLKNRAMASNSSMNLQDAAALNLAIPVCVDRHTVEKIPLTMLRNVTESFESLIDSRLRSSMIALLRQIVKLGDAGAREAKVLKELLSSKTPPISLTTIVTTFRVLPKSEAPHFNNFDLGCHGFTLPLVFEAVIDAKVLASPKLVTLSLATPGMISGSFHKDGLLEKLEVALDTIELLQAMMKQARVVVKEAMARAASIATSVVKSVPLQAPQKPSPPNLLGQIPSSSCVSSGSLVGLSQRLQDTIREINVEQAKSNAKNEEQPGRGKKRKRMSFGGHSPPGSSHEESAAARVFALAALGSKCEPGHGFEQNPDGQGCNKKPQLFSWLRGDGMLLDEDEAERRDQPQEESFAMGMGFFGRIAAQTTRAGTDGSESTYS